MNGTRLLMLGAGHYRQGPGALSLLGQEALPFGKKALVVTGTKAWEAAKSSVTSSLEEQGIAFSVMPYGTYCTERTASIVAGTAESEKVDLVIGVGGGRCLDTAKFGAHKAGLRCITVPTIAATCAAYVPLCVVYDDTGATQSTVETNQEVASCLVDTAFLVSSSPKRTLAAGIADAMAKEPELLFSIESKNNPDRSTFPFLGSYVSHYTTGEYLGKGIQALTDFSKHRVTDAIEDIVSTNLALTGMISCLVSGGKHLAIAHAFYDCTTASFKKQRARFLHGELVGCALPVQMYVNGSKEEEITHVVEFLESIGIPTKISAFGIEPTRHNEEMIVDYICRNVGISDSRIRQKVQEGFSLICR